MSIAIPVTFIGSTVTAQYYFNGGPYIAGENGAYVNAGSPVTFVVDGTPQAPFRSALNLLYEIIITETQIIYDFASASTWNPSGTSLDQMGLYIDNGNLLTFFDAPLIETLSVNASTNMAGFSFGNVTFTGERVAVDWDTLRFDAGTRVVLDINVAPPEVIVADGPWQQTAYVNLGTGQAGLLEISIWGGVVSATLDGAPVDIGGDNAHVIDIDANGPRGFFGAGQATTRLNGNHSNNTIIGSVNADYIDGNGGIDQLTGGDGDDTFVYEGDGDIVYEQAGGGTDTILSTVDFLADDWQSLTNPTFDASGGSGPHIEILRLWDGAVATAITAEGTGDDNRIEGNRNANVLSGLGGSDVLVGLAGDDSLDGGSENDTLIGGRGADTMTGGGGGDTFQFDSILDSRSGPPGGISMADIITDFLSGLDHLDLSRIDADATLEGHQAFTFVGNAVYSGSPGEVRFFRNADRTLTFVQGDIDGDLRSDFSIQLNGRLIIGSADFIFGDLAAT